MITDTAHPNPEDIMAWSDQELDPSNAAHVRAHVDNCASCRAVADNLRDLRARADQWQVEPAPVSVRVAVMSAASSAVGGPARLTSPQPLAAGFWRRYRWQLVAASAVIAAVFVGAQVSLCGEVICHLGGTRAPEPIMQAPASADFETAWQALPRIDLGIPADGAAVVIAWFVDYECPACQAADPIYTGAIDQYVAAYPRRVKFVVLDWPWNTECNPNVQTTFVGHEASCAAAVAMHLAEGRGRGAAMKAWLFSHQRGATAADVRAAAASVAGVNDFDARYPAERDALRARLASIGPAVGNFSTPSCFINGVWARDSQGRLISPQDLARAIEFELRKRR
jgi:hypothetical protein